MYIGSIHAKCFLLTTFMTLHGFMCAAVSHPLVKILSYRYMNSTALIIWPQVGLRSTAVSAYVHLFVCLSQYVCPLVYLKNYTSKFYQTICTCYLWPSLVSPLTTM